MCLNFFSVLKVRIRKVVDDGNGDKVLVLKRKVKSYKPKTMPKKDKKNLKLIIQNGTHCDCEVAEKAKKSSLVMASKVGDKFIVTYVSDWVKNKEFKRAIRAIRKGHDCKVMIDPDQTDSSNGGLSINGSPLPTVNGPVKKDKDKKKKDRGKDRGKDKDKDKDKKKNDDEDPMANFGRHFSDTFMFYTLTYLNFYLFFKILIAKLIFCICHNFSWLDTKSF